MKSLLQNSRNLLAAFAVATAGLTAPALANDTNAPTANVETVAYGNYEYRVLDQTAAEEYGAGKIVLHIGENFPLAVARVAEQNLDSQGYDAEIVMGGPDGMLRLIIDGQSGAKHFDVGNTAAHLERVVAQVARPELRHTASLETPALDGQG